MVTDEDIIAKAVWNLDRSPGEVTRIFNAWVDALLADVRNGARAEIPSVGTLFQYDGRIVFVPDESREQNGDAS